MQLSLIIPIFNERAHLPQMIEALGKLRASALAPEGEILLVDDGSTDGGSEWLAQTPLPEGMRLLRHRRNRGYGAALRTGIRAARHDLIAIADADGTYPLERVPDLAHRLESDAEASMIVGTRTAPEARRSIPLVRRPAKWFLTRLAEHLAEAPIPDLNSGLRVFRRQAVEPFLHLTPAGFSFTTTITLALLTNGHEILWEPVAYHARSGSSKIRPVRDTLGFLQLILRTVLYFNPMKVFLPISAALFTGGIALLIARLVMPHPFGIATTVILFAAALQMLAVGLIADLIDKRLR